ncbi:MAG: precorrin-2 C(20)-methyltransferase [Actinomycetota bacterium]|nr:precorrin-2 C(20)-methyltransferase [Actinomycetota bacterium]
MNSPSAKQDEPGQLIGVGVGPGDPKNITLKALEALREADLIFAPCSSPESEGRAESIARQVLPDIELNRLIFDMSPGETGVQARIRGARAAARTLVALLRKGQTLAFVTLGDPNVFSTFSLVAKEVATLAPEIRIRTVPGIMAFQEVAAMSGLNLLDETEKLFLVTAVEGIEDVAESLQHPNAAVVIYKGGRQIAGIKQILTEAGRLEGAVVGELLGLEGEQIALLEAITEPKISYLATVIAPPLRKGSHER